MTATFRRRIDNLVLRWQARLDSEWMDRVFPWLAAVVLFVWLAALSLAKARSLDGGIDLAAYTQVAWDIRHGHDPIMTITNGADVLAQQAAFAFYPMIGITYLLPIIPGLLVLQSALLSLAIVPLWRLCRRVANLRVGAAATLTFVYAVYPVMHNLNLQGFHPEVIAVPGLLAMFFFAFTGRWRLFALACVVVMASRADLGFAVAGFGALLVVEGHRRKGTMTLLAGIGWTLLAGLVIQPHFGGGTFPHVEAFAQFGSSPGSVAWGMISHPLDVLSRLVSEQNFDLFVTLFAPVVFLPLIAPRYLIPVLPLQVLYMVADVPHDAVFGQQTVAITAFIFLATAMALSRLGRLSTEKVLVDRRLLAALLLAGSVFFIRDAASSPYRQPWDWGGQDLADAARIDVRDVVGPDAAVRASPSMLQVLAERQVLYELDPTPATPPQALTDGVDDVVVDERALQGWSAADVEALVQGLEDKGFRIVFDRERIVVFRREGA